MPVPAAGDVLLGKYRVERVLGQGGMGIVVSAVHLQLDDHVAIKFLLPEAMQHPELVERFGREARAAVKIKGEHVCRVLDVGTLPSGEPYMVMEHLRGRDLAAVVAEHGPLPPALAVAYVLQACEALAEAHSYRIVHRDLKPANLFLCDRNDGFGSIKVLDFGISKSVAAPDGPQAKGLTGTAAMMGSPLYMSPEQLESARDVDARADIWSLGVVLYELLTGTTPFDGASVALLCVAILQRRPARPRELRPDVPAGLDAVVMRCLEKDREQRFRDIGELAAALAPFGDDRAPHSLGRVSSFFKPPVASAITAPRALDPAGNAKTEFDVATTARSVQPKGKNGPMLAIAGVALVAGAVGVGVSIGGRKPQPAADPSLVATPVASVPATASIAVAPIVSPVESGTAAASVAAMPPPPGPRPATGGGKPAPTAKPTVAAPKPTGIDIGY